MVFKCQMPGIEQALKDNGVALGGDLFWKIMNFQDPIFVFDGIPMYPSTQYKKWDVLQREDLQRAADFGCKVCAEKLGKLDSVQDGPDGEPITIKGTSNVR